MMPSDEKAFVTLIGPESVMQLLGSVAVPEGVTIGEPQPLDALADMVDSPLGPDEIKALMEFATVALKLGTAATQLIIALKLLLAKSEGGDKARIVLVDGKTNAEIVSITKDTDPEEASRKIAAASKK
jgi:hypothetical protein